MAVQSGDGNGGINKGEGLSLPSKTVAVNWKRSVFKGLARVIVQSGTELGEIQLTAHAKGLTRATVVIEAKGHSIAPERHRSRHPKHGSSGQQLPESSRPGRHPYLTVSVEHSGTSD
jgi:hypothetical protein